MRLDSMDNKTDIPTKLKPALIGMITNTYALARGQWTVRTLVPGQINLRGKCLRAHAIYNPPHCPTIQKEEERER